MYTLILYDDNQKCIESLTNLIDVSVNGKTVHWHDGFIRNIEVPFAVIEGEFDIEIGQDISVFVGQDKKEKLLPMEKRQEETNLTFQAMMNTVLLDPKDLEQENEIKMMQIMLNELLLSRSDSTAQYRSDSTAQ